MLLRFVLSVGLSVIWLTGCASKAQLSPETPVTLPAFFSQSGEADLSPRWWTDFGDASLNAAVEQALSGNFSLRAARDRLDQADAVLRREGSAQRPSLNLTAGAASTRRDSGAGEISGETYSLGLAAAYELDLWGRLNAATDAQRFEREATREALESAGMTLAAETTRAWIDLAWRREEIALFHEQIKTSTSALEWLRIRFQQGQSRAADVLQQEQSLEGIKASLAQSMAEAKALALRLDVLRGVPPSTEPLSEVRIPALPPLPMFGIPSELLQRRPDVREKAFRVQAADRNVAEAMAARRPRLNLSARIVSEATSPTRLLEEWIASVAGDVLMPLIDGGSRRAEADRTRALLAQRVNEYGQTLLEALSEVETTLAREQAQQQVVEHRETQVRLAEEALARIQDLYQIGAADFQRWITARLSYQSAQQQWLSSRAQLLGTRIDLHRAVGGALNLSPSSENSHE